MVGAALANLPQHSNQHTRGAANLRDQPPPMSQADAARMVGVSEQALISSLKLARYSRVLSPTAENPPWPTITKLCSVE